MPALPPSSPVEALVDECSRILGPESTESQWAACVYDVRRALLTAILNDAPSVPEDLLRDSLPPLIVPRGPLRPQFSAWRGALTAVLGLICASALAQALALSGGLAVLLTTLGVAFALWAADKVAHGAAQGPQGLIQWGPLRLRWKSLRRYARLVWLGLLLCSLLRDFLQQNAPLQALLEAFSAFLTQGISLYLVQNIYGALALVAIFALVSQRPVRLDCEEYRARLRMVAENWWAGALLCRDALVAQYQARHDAGALQKVHQELYSFASELPGPKALWLRERLRQLGFSVEEEPREQKELLWSPGLSARYEALGYLEEGEACFVDTPPLLEGDLLVRKGTVRKIRR